MEKVLAEKIVAEVKRWASSNTGFEKDNPSVSAQLKNLTVQDISLGDTVKFCVAHIEGDVTAVGGSAPQEYNATMKRTEAFRFTTRSFAYFDKSQCTTGFLMRNFASLEGYEDVVVNEYMGSELPEAKVYADRSAKVLAEKSLKRLNLYYYSHRVNEFEIVQETEVRESKFVAIYADLKEPKKETVIRTIIGFYDTESDKLYLSNIGGLVNSQSIGGKTSKSVRRQSRVKIIVGVVVALVIVGAIVYGFLM